MTTPPVFRFSPNAYDVGLFRREPGRCDVCGIDRDWRYRASFYAITRPEHICPWCVADGRAAR